MNIIGVLKQEESKLRRQLTAVQDAMLALNDGPKTAVSSGHATSSNGASAKRMMPAAVRAKLSRSAKARWAKIKAAKAKKAKS